MDQITLYFTNPIRGAHPRVGYMNTFSPASPLGLFRILSLPVGTGKLRCLPRQINGSLYLSLSLAVPEPFDSGAASYAP